MLRAPLAALTIIATVGLGLGVVAAVPGSFTRDDYDALERETDVFSDAFASRVNGTLFQVIGIMPDGFRGLEVVAVVSETVAQQLWPGANALGQVLRIEPDLTIGRRDLGLAPTAAAPRDRSALRRGRPCAFA